MIISYIKTAYYRYDQVGPERISEMNFDLDTLTP